MQVKSLPDEQEADGDGLFRLILRCPEKK